MGFLANAGEHSAEVLKILRYMLALKQEREKEHMQKRRAKLAADAKASGDGALEAAWLDPEQTTDEMIREEVRKVHIDYFPILQELQPRLAAAMKACEGPGVGRNEPRKPRNADPGDWEVQDTNTRNAEYHMNLAMIVKVLAMVIPGPNEEEVVTMLSWMAVNLGFLKCFFEYFSLHLFSCLTVCLPARDENQHEKSHRLFQLIQEYIYILYFCQAAAFQQI